MTYSCSGSRPSLSVQSVQRDRRGDTSRGGTSPSSAGTGRAARGSERSRYPASTPDSSDSRLTSLCELQETTGSTSGHSRVIFRQVKAEEVNRRTRRLWTLEMISELHKTQDRVLNCGRCGLKDGFQKELKLATKTKLQLAKTIAKKFKQIP